MTSATYWSAFQLLVSALKALADSSFGAGAGGIFGQFATAISGQWVWADGGPVSRVSAEAPTPTPLASRH